MDKLKIVENIQRICKERGTNPTVAGRESGAGETMVTNLKRKGTLPSIEKMQLLAKYLDVTVSELLGEEKKPTPVSGDGPREEAHKLVDQLPLDKLAEAVRYMKFIKAPPDTK